MTEHPRISIVIPCYRDEASVPALFARLGPVMDSLEAPAELILVDDGSPDRTALRAIELARDFSHPTSVVRLSRKRNQPVRQSPSGASILNRAWSR